jgi:hypothetical protein
MLSESPLPPGEGKIIGLADRTVDAQSKGSETFPVYSRLKKNPTYCGRPKKLAKNR